VQESIGGAWEQHFAKAKQRIFIHLNQQIILSAAKSFTHLHMLNYLFLLLIKKMVASNAVATERANT